MQSIQYHGMYSCIVASHCRDLHNVGTGRFTQAGTGREGGCHRALRRRLRAPARRARQWSERGLRKVTRQRCLCASQLCGTLWASSLASSHPLQTRKRCVLFSARDILLPHHARRRNQRLPAQLLARLPALAHDLRPTRQFERHLHWSSAASCAAAHAGGRANTALVSPPEDRQRYQATFQTLGPRRV